MTSTRPRVDRLPVDHVLTGYFALMLALSCIEAPRLPHPARPIAIHAGGLLVSWLLPIAVRRMSEGPRWIVRTIVSLAMVPIAFEEVGRLVPYVSPDARESWLLRADRWLLGSDPTRWTGSAEAFPWLTEFLQIVYFLFYFLPLALSVRLFLRRDFRAIEHAMLVIVLGFLLSYLGYFLIPARSPYHLYAYPFELRGLWVTEALRKTVDALEAVKYDCFPSGHSEIAMLVAALARRYDRAAYRVFFGPIGVLLPLSTIYLRYHYAVDVIAAVAFAWVTWKVAAWLEREAGRPAWRLAAAPKPAA